MSNAETPDELALKIHERLTVVSEYHVRYEELRVCWKLKFLHDSKWRMDAIATFAEQNGWEAEQSDYMVCFRKKRAPG